MPAVNAFQEAFPDIPVEVNTINGNVGSTELQQKFVLFNHAGKGWPDAIFLPSNDDIAWASSSKINYARDLSSDLGDLLAGYPAGVIEQCKIEGQFRCLRNDAAPDVFWYDQVLLAEWGYEPPTTWEQYESLSLRIAAEHPGHLTGFVGDAYAPDRYLWASGCPTNDTASEKQGASIWPTSGACGCGSCSTACCRPVCCPLQHRHGLDPHHHPDPDLGQVLHHRLAHVQRPADPRGAFLRLHRGVVMTQQVLVRHRSRTRASSAPAVRRVRARKGHAAAVLVAPYVLLLLVGGLIPTGYAVVKSLQNEAETGFGGLSSYQRVAGDFRFVETFANVALVLCVWLPLLLTAAVVLALLVDASPAGSAPRCASSTTCPARSPASPTSCSGSSCSTPARAPWTSSGTASATPASTRSPNPGTRRRCPNQIVESARLDGLSDIQTFFKIALPISKQAVALVGFFSFVANWTNYFLPLLLLPLSNSTTVSVGLQQLVSSSPLFDPTNAAGLDVRLYAPHLALATLVKPCPYSSCSCSPSATWSAARLSAR